MGILSGRTILITGAARGQGRSHAVTAAREGADVIVTDVCGQIETVRYPLATPEDLRETVRLVEEQGGKAVAATADTRDPEALEAAVQAGLAEFGKIDGCVANAGIYDFGPKLWETEEASWNTILDVNLSGVWRTLKAVAPHMIAGRYGSVVAISSTNGLQPGVGYTAYVAAKHGVIGVMRNAALELGPYNVRCNAICPGAIDTPMMSNPMTYAMFGPVSAESRKNVVEAVYGYGVLAGRSLIPPQAVSNAVVWLLSDLSEQITGVHLSVDTGHGIQPGWNGSPVKTGPEADRYRPPTDVPG